MSLAAGARLGGYEITRLLGRGGMGEVYRARDLKLGRDVAIKVLSSEFTTNPDRIARFRREAQVLATLNHPHIAAIYGLDEDRGEQFLVLELIEGGTLADRLSRGSIPVTESLAIAKQIASALEAAHERGVIHRDLKPANVAVTENDQVKVLDFGLAKFTDSSRSGFDAPDSQLTNSPTAASPLVVTSAGVLLGTAPYMAPEQAKGKPVDRRCDVWAFGCVLYEMLTGERAFAGSTSAETLAAIIHMEPAWEKLPHDTPAHVRTVLQRCLRKEPEQRIRDLGDLGLALDGAFDSDSATLRNRTIGWPRVFAVAAAALLVGAMLAAGAVWLRAPAIPVLLSRFVITHDTATLHMQVDKYDVFGRFVAVSPDGRHIAYAVFDVGSVSLGGVLYVRSLDDLEPKPLGSVRTASDLFISPDNQWVGYIDTSDVSLKRVAIAGGPPMPITAPGRLKSIVPIYGASWAPGDQILMGSESGVWSVAASGGEPQLLIKSDPTRDDAYAFPFMLPDGKAILVTIAPRPPTSETSHLAVVEISTGTRKVLIDRAGGGEFMSSGHIVYGLNGTIFAVPFDLANREVRGPGVVVGEGALLPPTFGINQGATLDRTRFSASNSTVTYLAGTAPSNQRTLVWVDRQGKETIIPAEPRAYVYARLSPDGSRIALDARDQENDVWVLNLVRGGMTRLTTDPGLNRSPVWSVDGQRIAFSIAGEGNEEIYWQAADGAGRPLPLTHDSGSAISPSGFSPDGKFLVFSRVPGPADVKMTDVSAGVTTTLLGSPFDEYNGVISPNGHWLAYESDESGASQEIYVRPFPDVGGGRWQVSTEGGMNPLWARNGRELFYLVQRPDASVVLMTVPVDPGAKFLPGKPIAIAHGPYGVPIRGTGYDVSPDGQRFLFIKTPPSNERSVARIVVVQNWPKN